MHGFNTCTLVHCFSDIDFINKIKESLLKSEAAKDSENHGIGCAL